MHSGGSDIRITEEVEYWLELSEIYFQELMIKEHPGPIWFLLTELLEHEHGTCTIGHIKDALTTAGVARSSAAHDASQYCRYLEECELIEIVADQTRPARNIPVATIIKATRLLDQRISQYVRRLVRRLFDQQTALAASRDATTARATMKSINEFMLRRYVPCWEKFLKELAHVAAKPRGKKETTIFGDLRGSSEVFVLLHKLWEFHLRGVDTHGFTGNELCNQHLRTSASGNAMTKCIEMFNTYGLLDAAAGGGDHYRLHHICYPVFEEYAAEFVELRCALTTHLSQHLVSKPNEADD